MLPEYLTIQYLEPSAILAGTDAASVIGRLRAAAEKIPISHVLIGWHLPPAIVEACRIEADRLGIRFLRWQPLLTADGEYPCDPDWQTVNIAGCRVMGDRGLPEFTFFCPNHPGMREALSQHLEALIRQGLYQGFFLDRVRFPSPAADPINHLACFCEHCRKKASGVGLDLEKIRQEILSQVASASGRITLVKTLLSGKIEPGDESQSLALRRLIAFRKNNISEFLAFVNRPLKAAGLEVGLDCFSPSLTHMVGQDLNLLSAQVDWVKLMTYAHTLAPAGIPYELLGLARYLLANTQPSEAQVLDLLREASQLPIPVSIYELEQDGLSPSALQSEVKRGVVASSAPALAGIELVDLPGVTRLATRQILADLTAIQHAQPAGLAISWDLWHIPLDRLDLIRQVI